MESADVTAIATCVAAIANIVIAAGVLLAKRQLEVSKEAMNKDHKRSQLMLSLELCREWNRSADPETAAAQRLISLLDPQTCEELAQSFSTSVQDMEIPKKHQPLVETCLAGSPSEPSFFEERKGQLFITAPGVKRLSYLGVHYLNELEIVLSAWQEDVGDKAYLAEQFSFLDGDDFRRVFSFGQGIERAAFPAIEAFLSRNRTDAH